MAESLTQVSQNEEPTNQNE